MIKLYQGDCLQVMDKLIEDEVKVDSIITDPPYGTTNCSWDTIIPFDEMWIRLNKIVKDNGAIVLFGSEPFSSALRMSNIKQYKYDWVWDKKLATGFLNAKIQPLRRNEIISVFYEKQCVYNPQMEKRGKRTKGNSSNIGKGKNCYGTFKAIKSINDIYYPTTILEFSNADRNNKLHPTQKPVALMEYLVKTYTNENDTVLDFTMGSGSTGVACKNLKRNFIGIELDKNYFEIAKKRIEETKIKGRLI